MTKVKINGYGNQSSEEFEVLNKETLVNILSELDRDAICRQCLDVADRYSGTGIAYIYLDARDGEVEEGWVGNNEMLHPFDSFYEIILVDELTPICWDDLSNEDFIDEMSDEWEEFQEWLEDNDGVAEDFIEEKYGKEELDNRMSVIMDCWVENMEFRDDIDEQIYDLYANKISTFEGVVHYIRVGSKNQID